MIQNYINNSGMAFKDGIWRTEDSDTASFSREVHDLLFEIEDNSFWFKHRNRCIAELVKRIPPNGTIFDVGGGNGFVTKGLHDAGFDVALVEPGAGGAFNARKRGGFEIICAPFSREFFKPNSAPAVALFDVIEHIEDDADFLKEVHGLMHPGGYLYLTVPAYMRLWSQEDDSAGHFRRYTRKSLRKLLQSCGFETLFDSCFFAYLPLPIFLMRTLPYKMGHRRKDPTEKAKRELTSARGGILPLVLGKLSDFEVNRLAKGGRFPFGGSVLMAAQKR